MSRQVADYERMPDEPASAKFERVRELQDKYIKQGSNFEINIESKMRDVVMKVMPRPIEHCHASIQDRFDECAVGSLLARDSLHGHLRTKNKGVGKLAVVTKIAYIPTAL